MKNFEVALVSHTFNRKKGGKEIILWELVEGLLERGVRINVFANKCVPIDHNNFKFYKVPKFGKLLGIHKWVFARLAKRAVCRVKNDIVFTNGNVGFGDVIRLGGLPYLRRQELMEEEKKQIRFFRQLSLKKKLSHVLEKQSIYNPELKKIVAVSSLVRNEFLMLYREISKKKFEIIPNGLEYSYFDRQEYLNNKKNIRNIYSIGDDENVILFVGNNFKLKGLEKIFDLLVKIDNTHLIIVGSDEISIPDNIKKQVHLAGWKNEVQPYYDAADYFCLPSLADGFGLVVLEALSRGCYILISDHVGAKDIIKHEKYGTVFHEIGEVKPIIDNNLYLDEAMRTERRLYVRKYNKNEMVNNYMEVFTECLG